MMSTMLGWRSFAGEGVCVLIDGDGRDETEDTVDVAREADGVEGAQSKAAPWGVRHSSA
jgi:hypothetical protein